MKKKSDLLCLYKSSKKALQVSQLRVQWGLRTSSKGLTALRGLAPPSGLVPGIVGKVKLLVLDVLLLSAISSPLFSIYPDHHHIFLSIIHSKFPTFFLLSLSLLTFSPSFSLSIHALYRDTKKKDVKIKFRLDV